MIGTSPRPARGAKPECAPTTADEWARQLIETTNLQIKFAPGPLPSKMADPPLAAPLRPGRPTELIVVERPVRANRRSLKHTPGRARLFHAFLHHELQAAELMAWAYLRFPDTPTAFRRGLLAIAVDEIRHLNLYREYLTACGHPFGSFEVRDWFWEKLGGTNDVLVFLATLGIGFEGANLDHTLRFSAQLRAVGDEPGAALQELVGREEVGHVKFALHWYQALGGSMDFDCWRKHLAPPLSPVVMRGRPQDAQARLEAGMSQEFIEQLADF